MLNHLIRKDFQQITSTLQGLLVKIDTRTVLAFGLPFIIYVSTLAPTIYNLDSAELTTAAATGGLMRATGYPLYLSIGYLWSHIPIGDVGYRMNLFSAFNGALTIALAERIFRRWQINNWATFGALGLLAGATYFWALSLIAEVYTLHTALTAALILLLIRWSDHPTPLNLTLVGLVTGLSLSNHAATVLLIPGVVWYILACASRQALRPKTLALTLGSLLIGLSFYLYLPLRYLAEPAFNYAGYYNANGLFHPINLTTFEGFWRVVTGRDFSWFMFSYNWRGLLIEGLIFIKQLWRAFFVIGIAPGILGMVVLLRRNWRLGSMLLLMFLGHALFYIDYRALDKELMFLPSYLIWALWIGVGFQWLLDWIRNEREPSKKDSWILNLVHLVIAGTVLLTFAWNWPLVDLSNDWSVRERGEDIMQQVEHNALIFGHWDTIPVIQYLQLVEGQRPDIQTVNRFQIYVEHIESMIRQNIRSRPIYIDSLIGTLGQTYQTEQAGPLYRLMRKD